MNCIVEKKDLTNLTQLGILFFMKEWNSKNIWELRDRLKVTQKAFSELLGVTENYIYLLEKGVKKPSKTFRLLLDCVEKEKGREVKKHGKRHL